MGRKSKETLKKEFKNARVKYMRIMNDFARCHPNSKRYSELQEKVMIAEENCVLLNRKIHNWKHGDCDKLI